MKIRNLNKFKRLLNKMCIRKQYNWKRQRDKLPILLEEHTGLPLDICEVIYMFCEYKCKCMSCCISRFARKRKHNKKRIIWTTRGWDIDERTCRYHGLHSPGKRVRI